MPVLVEELLRLLHETHRIVWQRGRAQGPTRPFVHPLSLQKLARPVVRNRRWYGQNLSCWERRSLL